MFALGAVAYELARGKGLSGNGPDYEGMRKVRAWSRHFEFCCRSFLIPDFLAIFHIVVSQQTLHYS